LIKLLAEALFLTYGGKDEQSKWFCTRSS
jgi:hypothetical protein